MGSYSTLQPMALHVDGEVFGASSSALPYHIDAFPDALRVAA
jgi:diacylglycerol kinase family enzyme